MEKSEIIRILEMVDAIVDEYDLDLPDGYKRRDSNEPNRAIKEYWEIEIAKIFRKRFRRQAVIIREYLENHPIGKAAGPGGADIPIGDPETDEQLIKAFIGMMDDGFQISGITASIELSFAQYNEEALNWVDQWVYELTDMVDATTGKRLERELTNFIADEGYTIADVMNGLERSGLDRGRAEDIAVSEVTRTFGKSEYVVGQVAAAEYPDVRVVKTWFTNNDSMVCPICRPLNGRTILMDQEFLPEILHPPAHPKNCRCWMQTETDILEEMDLYNEGTPGGSQLPIPGISDVPAAISGES